MAYILKQVILQALFLKVSPADTNLVYDAVCVTVLFMTIFSSIEAYKSLKKSSIINLVEIQSLTKKLVVIILLFTLKIVGD